VETLKTRATAALCRVFYLQKQASAAHNMLSLRLSSKSGFQMRKVSCNAERSLESDIRKIKRQEVNREYYLRNKDNARVASRNYYLRNNDTKKKSNREYYILNRDSIRKYQREHNAQHNERKDYFLHYRKENEHELKKYGRDYYIRNNDSKRTASREYYRRNLDNKREKSREYYNRNLDDVKECYHDYYQRNKDNRNDYRRDYYVRNKENPELYSPRETVFKSWKTPAEVREFFESIANDLSVNDFTDWYRVSRAQIFSFGGISRISICSSGVNSVGGSLYSKFENLGAALQYAFPHFEWDLDKFSYRGKKAGQRRLRVMIEELIPGTDVVEDYLHPSLVYGMS
jgi:hypothetical protein